MINYQLKKAALVTIFVYSLMSCVVSPEVINLSGEWQVALDSLDTGVGEKWFERDFTDMIQLPGTLCDGGYGTPCTLKPAMEREIFLNLKRKYDYTGVAWYRKTVDIPEGWDNKTILLHLERVIWNSQLWVDGRRIEQQNESLVAPHLFDLTGVLSPGKHMLALRIDNRKQYDISREDMAHAYTNETQTIWNGVTGNILLKACEKVYIQSMTLTPDVDASKVHVEINIKNDMKKAAAGKIQFHVVQKGGLSLPPVETDITGDRLSFDYAIENPALWDEFNPHLYTAVAILGTEKTSEKKEVTFGMRKLSVEDALLRINNRRMFLRGTLECCIFPLKGYPPTNREEWKKLFETAKSYGLNHLRFHSWCPPEAAFEVADETGFYLQVELPYWETAGQSQETMDFLASEADKMINHYGNHPSFCFWSMGNELSGDLSRIDSLMTLLKNKDRRRLYMTTTFTFEKGHGSWPEPHDDFWVTQWTKKGWVRGQGIFDNEPVNFESDYSKAIDSLSVPIVTHEIGQYSVFPDLKEIEKYRGNLTPLNFIAIKNDLESKGRLHQAADYTQSSGKLAAILYKEEIERALKTPGFSGFQLLDLHDFPGQGTALVGLLNAFWESKGIITPEEFRNFCSPVTPLVRLPKATYTGNEQLQVKAELANFSNTELKGIVPLWKLTGTDGRVVAEGKLPPCDACIGNNIPLGNFSVNLSTLTKAEKLTLVLSLENHPALNSWEIWVYPELLPQVTGNVICTRRFDETKEALDKGKTVLFNPPKEEVAGLEGKFVQVFWSPVHFPNQPGTMGVLCDPAHPALKDFPTEMHSNWQWWDLCKNAKTLELDALGNIEPIVRMVDNFYKNRNLGLIFEARVGSGKLLFCSPDLNDNLTERPVARQMLYSLLNYMQSEQFQPASEITFEQIEKNYHYTTLQTH
jgi:hypothetical protein